MFRLNINRLSPNQITITTDKMFDLYPHPKRHVVTIIDSITGVRVTKFKRRYILCKVSHAHSRDALRLLKNFFIIYALNDVYNDFVIMSAFPSSVYTNLI